MASLRNLAITVLTATTTPPPYVTTPDDPTAPTNDHYLLTTLPGPCQISRDDLRLSADEAGHDVSRLVLGGVEIPADVGFDTHSDGRRPVPCARRCPCWRYRRR
jgi:hypothetical protein